jgi:predicted amidohydrolase
VAAVASGGYVINSSRVGGGCGPRFAGHGLAFAPEEQLLAKTSQERELLVVEIDPRQSQRQKCKYPCYQTTDTKIR